MRIFFVVSLSLENIYRFNRFTRFYSNKLFDTGYYCDYFIDIIYTMVLHTCQRCGKEFKYKSPYNYHINKNEKSLQGSGTNKNI